MIQRVDCMWRAVIHAVIVYFKEFATHLLLRFVGMVFPRYQIRIVTYCGCAFASDDSVEMR